MAMNVSVTTQLGVGSSSTVDTAMDFTSDTVRKRNTHSEHNGMRGSRSLQSERIRAGNSFVGGGVSMEPAPEELAWWFPRILGANASGTTYALAETLPEFYLTSDRVAKVFTYAGMQVNSATFTGGEGSIVSLSVDLLGKTETVANSGTFPSLTPTDTAPFMFTDGVLTVGGTGYAVKQFSCTISNNLQVAYNNSTSPSYIKPGVRVVSFNCVVPYSSTETALYAQAVAGAATTFVLTNAGYSLTFSFAAWQVPSETPVVTTRNGELVMELNGICRRTTATRELIVTLDSTP